MAVINIYELIQILRQNGVAVIGYDKNNDLLISGFSVNYVKNDAVEHVVDCLTMQDAERIKKRLGDLDVKIITGENKISIEKKDIIIDTKNEERLLKLKEYFVFRYGGK